MFKYGMNVMNACYLKICNFGESHDLAVMLPDFCQNCELRNICHMHTCILY